jgi:hypothetical protein
MDSDADGLPDTWEIEFFGNLTFNATDDPDGDGETNVKEFEGQSDPTDGNDPEKDSTEDGTLLFLIKQNIYIVITVVIVYVLVMVLIFAVFTYKNRRKGRSSSLFEPTGEGHTDHGEIEVGLIVADMVNDLKQNGACKGERMSTEVLIREFRNRYERGEIDKDTLSVIEDRLHGLDV